MPASRSLSIFDAGLFTNSTAIDVDNGELVPLQHVPAEALDLDEVFEQVLIDRGDDKLVFSIGKHEFCGNMIECPESLSTLKSYFQKCF